MRAAVKSKFLRQKGIALFLTLVVLTLISIIGFGLVSITNIHSRQVQEKQQSLEAYYLARMGISKSLDELKTNYWWATDAPYTYALATEDGDMTEGYEVSIWAHPDNAIRTNKIWKVTSKGIYHGNQRLITAWLAPETFAVFAYFTDSEKMGTTTIWFWDKDELYGRVHTNGYFSVSGHPKYTDKVTSTNAGDSKYYDTTNRYYQGGKWYSDPTRFFNYYSSYNYDSPIAKAGYESKFSFAGGQPDIPLPTNTDSVKNAANKTYTYNTKLKFYDNGTVRVLNQNKITGQWSTEYVNTDLLTLHVDGKVYLEGGTLKGKCTVGCTGDLEIQNSLVYKDDKVDCMGVVAGNDIIVKTDPYTKKDLTLHMTMMALNGSFYVDKYSSGYPRGTLSILGGLIQYQRGPVGTFSGGSISTGYSKNYRYDEKLKTSPPPNYPTTQNVVITAVKDHMALDE